MMALERVYPVNHASHFLVLSGNTISDTENLLLSLIIITRCSAFGCNSSTRGSRSVGLARVESPRKPAVGSRTSCRTTSSGTSPAFRPGSTSTATARRRTAPTTPALSATPAACAIVGSPSSCAGSATGSLTALVPVSHSTSILAT